jgi:GTPase
MTKSTQFNHKEEAKRAPAVLVGVDLPWHFGRAIGGDSDLPELARLVDTAGGKVVGSITQKRDRPVAATFMGKGKLEDLSAMVTKTGAKLVVFDNELSPAQGRNIEKALSEQAHAVSVLDRTELILDIFASHARTSQARLQVELAQLQYMLPRLTKLWSHLERQAGGIGTRGPGETQLETDRRLIGRRIAKLKKDLLEIANTRDVQATRRQQQYTASLVGYTNAGKSTIMRGITGAGVLVQDKLFATLDATTRRVELDERRALLLSDTVGFIRRLPHHLVESFRATLQEVADSNLLVHVIDASSEDPEQQISAVNDVLSDLVPGDRETMMVFNKMDRLEPDEAERRLNRFSRLYPGALFVSALAQTDVEALRSALAAKLLAREDVVRLRVPITRMDLVAVFHRTASVIEEEHDADYCYLAVRLRPEELSRLLGKEPEIEKI